MKKELVLIAAGALFATAVYALPDYEPFADATGSGGTAYNAGDPLIGQKDALGQTWVAAGTATAPQPTIVSGSLSYAGLAPSEGNSANFGPPVGTSARLPLSNAVTNGTIYYSFLISVTNLGTLNLTTGGIFWVGFNNSTGSTATSPSTVGTRLYARTSGSGFQWGVNPNSSTASTTSWDTTVRSVGDTFFIVGSYTFNPSTSDDVSQLWINPSSSTFGNATAPAATVSATGGSDLSTIASFVLCDRHANEPYGIIDELTIATNWADVTPTPSTIAITSQPRNQRVVAGNTATFSVSTFRATTFQWQKSGGDISGATTNSFSITNVQAADAGTYDVVVGNGVVYKTSSNATLTVVPDIYPRLAPLWKIAPFSRPYLTSDTSPMERCIAYNALSNQVLLVSLTNTVTSSTAPAIYVLDADTGADLYQMFVDPSIVTGGINGLFTLSAIDVADDGAVYAANLADSSSPLRIYRWDNSGSNAGPVLIYWAYPAGIQSVRWGDSFAVRGAGTNTQILVDCSTGAWGSIIAPSDPTLTNSPWTENYFTNVAGGLTQGRTLLFYGTNNTFWEKHGSAGLNLVSYDTNAQTTSIVTNYPNLPGTPALVAFNSATNVLCAINHYSSTNTPDTLDLYDILNPLQANYLASYNFPTNHQANANACGRVIFAGDRVFALDANNGMAAYTLAPVLHVTPSAPNVVLSWSADVTGYTLKATPSLASPITWTNVSSGTLVGNQYFVTNSASAASLFYRLQK